MSGYLQRIASGVLHPERAIHPAVGSLWMPQRNAVRSEQFSEIMAPIVPRRSAQADAQQRHSALEHLSTEQRPAPDAPNPIEAKLEAFHPLVATRDATAAQARDGQDADTVAPRITFTPLVATSSHESLRQSRTLTPASIPSRERSLRTVQLTPSPAPQPDEIEIHIGRIEVAAVLPQPAPRPPARPARKSLDLSEYLKRDRRSR